MRDENPNAFKLLIGESLINKYFKNSPLNKKEIQRIKNELQKLELKPRVRLIANELRKALPQDYKKALKQLMRITREQKLSGFELWPATEFIQAHGLQHVDESLDALYELTQNFTSEFGIRPFINTHGEVIYKKLTKWKDDPSEDIRRWLSEGTRPRLPWGEKLQAAVQNPSEGLKILEHLKFDTSLYVRKSVGNHLNDIAKDHPELVVQTLNRWKKQTPQDYKKEFQFIAMRALRSLIKDGHTGALQFTGINTQKNTLKASPLKLNKTKIKMGEKLILKFSIVNKEKTRTQYVLDYVVYFKKANGALAPKVFKLKSGFIEAGQILEIEKSHPFKPITTRVYHSGKHQVALKLNGRELAPRAFDLIS